jgi:hypothetical protein
MAGLLERLGLEIGPPRIQPPTTTPYNVDLTSMLDLGPPRIQPPAATPYNIDLPGMLTPTENPNFIPNQKSFGNYQAQPSDFRFGDPEGYTKPDIYEALQGLTAAPDVPSVRGENAMTAQDPLEEIVPQSSYRKIAVDDAPQVAKQKAIQNEGSAAIVQSGGGDAELSAWDKLNQEFDMGVVGMALLASNDGSGNVGANLGKALMMGKQARMGQDDKTLQDQRSALKDSLEVRKTRAIEENAKSMRISAYARGTPKQVRSLPNNTQKDMFQAFADAKIANAPGAFSPSMSDEERNRWNLIANDALKFAEQDPSMAGVPTEQILEQAWTAQRTPGFFGGDFTFGATK